MRLTVDIQGEAKLDYAIGAIADGIDDWREVWPEVELVFYRAVLGQFRTEGQRGGEVWRPLSNPYKKWKELKYPGQPILVLTGRLRRSLMATGSNESIRDAQAQSLTLGTVTPYAKFHQTGTRKMAARPPLVLLRNDYGKIVSRMFRYAERIGKTAGFKTETRAQFTPGAE